MEKNVKSPIVLKSTPNTSAVATADALGTLPKTFSETSYQISSETPAEMSSATSPEPPRYNPLSDPLAGIGFLLVLVNFGIFQFSQNVEIFGGSFFFAHFLTVMFILFGLFSRRRETAWFPTRLNFTFIWLVLLQIGAFTLNQSAGVSVFPPSVNWLCFVLTTSALTLIAFTFRDFMPENVLKGLFFTLGVGFVIDLYFVLSNLPLTFVGVAGIWILGLTVYALAPILKVIYTLVFLYKSTDAKRPYSNRFFLYGAGFSLSLTVVFCLFWFNLVEKVKTAHAQTDSPLPTWVRVAQVLPPSVLSEKLLKSNQRSTFRGGLFSFENSNDRLHDPLVTLVNAIMPMPQLDETERANILRAIFDARNDAERRLWAGDNLTTTSAKTTVELFPNQRVAYTEMDLSIKNTAKNRSWDRQEAIFTFRLPEGGVVTALTLWVEGQPREAILTTKEKAEKAYNNIVGVQMRDPSVVHWQEGNAVSMRVFPCTPEAERRVKIGFTTPLRKVGERLHYENIQLEGTPATDAKADIQILGKNKTDLNSDLKLSDSGKNAVFNGDFPTNWSFDVACPPLSTAAFEFGDAAYRLVEQAPQYGGFEATEIWLDINKAWTQKDVDSVWDLCRSKPVFVWSNNQKTAVNEQNIKAIFKELSRLNFSVLPIQYVAPTALVIAKSLPYAPDFTALKGSKMGDELAEKLPNLPIIRIFCLENQSSTYLNTLQQMRVTQQISGSVEDLQKILTNKIFPLSTDSPTQFDIPQTGMTVVEMNRADNKISAAAPDHLMRLFSYNKILALVGRQYFKNDFDTEGAVRLANRANVVSPVSSLIVLETQKDYDRFEIKRSKGALGNAALSNAGAAPEPHEWTLIGLAVLVMGGLLFKRNTL